MSDSLETLEGIWPYFEWKTWDVGELGSALHAELLRKLAPYEAREEIDGDCDADMRSIGRGWAHELASSLRSYANVLGIKPEQFGSYHSACEDNLFSLVSIEDVSGDIVRTLGSGRTPGQTIFRPLCLEQANREIMAWLKRNPTYVDRVHHRTFEAIIAEVVNSHGWCVELTKRTRDGGYDLICLKNDTLGFPLTMIVEAKHYQLRNPVGTPMVDKLMGVASQIQPHKAVLVTNSRFTETVWTKWQTRVHRDLELVDREELFEWLRTYRSPSASGSEILTPPRGPTV